MQNIIPVPPAGFSAEQAGTLKSVLLLQDGDELPFIGANPYFRLKLRLAAKRIDLYDRQHLLRRSIKAQRCHTQVDAVLGKVHRAGIAQHRRLLLHDTNPRGTVDGRDEPRR